MNLHTPKFVLVLLLGNFIALPAPGPEYRDRRPAVEGAGPRTCLEPRGGAQRPESSGFHFR